MSPLATASILPTTCTVLAGWLGAQQYGAEGAALSSQPSPGPPDSLNGAEPSTSYIAIPVYSYRVPVWNPGDR